MSISYWTLTGGPWSSLFWHRNMGISVKHILWSHTLCILYPLVDTAKLFLRAVVPVQAPITSCVRLPMSSQVKERKKVKVAQPCPTLHDPMDYTVRRFSRPEYWNGLPCPSPGDLPNPGIKPRSPAMQANSLPAESPRKPRNTGMGSLSLLQGIFPTQGSKQGLLHCMQILYRLSYQGSPLCPSNLLVSPVFVILASWQVGRGSTF